MQMMRESAHWPWLSAVAAFELPDAVHWLTKMALAVVTGVLATVASEMVKDHWRKRKSRDRSKT